MLLELCDQSKFGIRMDYSFERNVQNGKPFQVQVGYFSNINRHFKV